VASGERSSGESRAPAALLVVLFSAALWFAAWAAQTWVPRNALVRRTLHAEWFHIAAHLLLYGTLYLLARWALAWREGASRVRIAVALTLAIAAVQEAIQCVAYRRRPGSGELFDLFVDGCAILVVHRWLARRGVVGDQAPGDGRLPGSEGEDA
jgi:hypothetical protein